MKKLSNGFKKLAIALLIPVIALVGLMTYAEVTGQYFETPNSEAWNVITGLTKKQKAEPEQAVSDNSISENDVSGAPSVSSSSITRKEVTVATTTWKTTTYSSDASNADVTAEPENDGNLEVHFLDVGQGDATLIRCGNEFMLIDGGNNNQGTNVQNYLSKHGVKSLKYIIATHPDADHIGGLDVVLYKFPCETLFMPDKVNNTKTYEELMEVVADKSIQPTLPQVGAIYTLGDADFTIVGPNGSFGDPNNSSIAVLLRHGSNSFLFSGDAGYDAEQAMLATGIDLDIDVYKVAHHGSKTSSRQELVDLMSPAYAVISVGDDNDYGHPHAEVLNRLRSAGVQVFRTDEQGTIVALSDGSSITWNMSPSTSWIAGEPKVADEQADAAVSDYEPVLDSTTYVCNTNTMKFHRPACESVAKIYMSNRLDVTESRETVIKWGYSPCGNCNP